MFGLLAGAAVAPLIDPRPAFASGGIMAERLPLVGEVPCESFPPAGVWIIETPAAGPSEFMLVCRHVAKRLAERDHYARAA
ncbi:MAG TPA: hypothetical protein VGG29_20840 [Caulobacteraceae bacterium]